MILLFITILIFTMITQTVETIMLWESCRIICFYHPLLLWAVVYVWLPRQTDGGPAVADLALNYRTAVNVVVLRFVIQYLLVYFPCTTLLLDLSTFSIKKLLQLIIFLYISALVCKRLILIFTENYTNTCVSRRWRALTRSHVYLHQCSRTITELNFYFLILVNHSLICFHYSSFFNNSEEYYDIFFCF